MKWGTPVLGSADRLPSSEKARSELKQALAACRGAFLGVALMSGVINVLYLTGSFFMLEVYDRVIPSRSVPTLLGLGALALFLFAVQGALDVLRGRILVRIGASLDSAISSRVYDAIVRVALSAKSGDALQPSRDLDQVRGFLASGGPIALFDFPWMPLYLLICFMFHPWIGWAAVGGAVLLVIITFLTDRWTREPARAAMVQGGRRAALGEASRRNAEVLQAMGMARPMAARWEELNADFLAQQNRAADVSGGLGATSKVLRMILQSFVLGLGAYLVTQQQATGGIMIASAILVARALAPVELAIAQWRGFVAARQGG